MISDASLIGLNAPLKNNCLALDILVPFRDLSICAAMQGRRSIFRIGGGGGQKLEKRKTIRCALRANLQYNILRA